MRLAIHELTAARAGLEAGEVRPVFKDADPRGADLRAAERRLGRAAHDDAVGIHRLPRRSRQFLRIPVAPVPPDRIHARQPQPRDAEGPRTPPRAARRAGGGDGAEIPLTTSRSTGSGQRRGRISATPTGSTAPMPRRTPSVTPGPWSTSGHRTIGRFTNWPKSWSTWRITSAAGASTMSPRSNASSASSAAPAAPRACNTCAGCWRWSFSPELWQVRGQL